MKRTIIHRPGIFRFLVLALMASSCKDKAPVQLFTVKNHLDTDRHAETVSIPLTEIDEAVKKAGVAGIVVKEKEHVLLSQPLDADGDGTADEIIFQTDIKAGGQKEFSLTVSTDTASRAADLKVKAYSRFVPERIDDYAWENDRVAFRTYGPVAQQLTESGQPGGTLTSGMDCWLKRVDYSIIDDWYKKNLDDAGYYHIDHGEGYDPYHVGGSRGCGGIGVWEDDTLYTSKNFVSYRTLANGPIRTVFELTYAPWPANGRTVTEKKIISLDLGSNLTRYEVNVTGDRPLPSITTGITLHDKSGEVKADSSARFVRYKETIDEAEFYTGIVLGPGYAFSSNDYRAEAADRSHIFITTTPVDDRVIYYAGFGWKKSGQFNTVAEWDRYLADFSKRLASPLEVRFVAEKP